MRRALIALALCAALSVRLAAQISVHDPAVTARNSVTAAVKELLLDTERLQHSQLRRMAQRLSLFTDAREVRPRGSASVAHAWRRLSVHAGVQRCPHLWRPCGRRLSCGESSDRGCQGSAGEAYAGGSPRDGVAARHAEHDRCRRHRGDQRHGPAAIQRTEARAACHRCAGGARHRSVERAERHGGARQDQRCGTRSPRGSGRRASSSWPASWSSCSSTRSGPETPTSPR